MTLSSAFVRTRSGSLVIGKSFPRKEARPNSFLRLIRRSPNPMNLHSFNHRRFEIEPQSAIRCRTARPSSVLCSSPMQTEQSSGLTFSRSRFRRVLILLATSRRPGTEGDSAKLNNVYNLRHNKLFFSGQSLHKLFGPICPPVSVPSGSHSSFERCPWPRSEPRRGLPAGRRLTNVGTALLGTPLHCWPDRKPLSPYICSVSYLTEIF